jgi:hypothetical protein
MGKNVSQAGEDERKRERGMNTDVMRIKIKSQNALNCASHAPYLSAMISKLK